MALCHALSEYEASMRPRHKAAENAPPPSRKPPKTSASMRPRHKAAENRHRPARELDQHVPASMRPRHKAAENVSP